MTEWWDRFERDAALRQATIDAYDGRHDVRDAVWWVEHPESAAPSGAAAPLAPLTDLQRAAFARPRDAAEQAHTGAHLQELEAFQAMVEADRRETLAALEEAQAVLDARPAERRRVGLLVGGLVAAVCVAGALAFGAVALFAPGGAAGALPLFGTADGGSGDGSSSSSDGDGDGSGDGGSNSVTITGDAPPGAGSFGAGAGAGTDASADGSSSQGSADDGGSSYGATLNDPEAAVPAPALTADPYPNIPATDTGADSYATVFSRPQSASDLPPFALPEGLIGETFRALSVGQNTPGAAYAAISDERMVCLVVYGNPLEYAYTCDTAAVVGSSGLQSSLSARDRLDSSTGALHPAVALSARWRADGTFTLDQSTPYDRD